jgi:L-lactate dehydrogenase complex protein LldE
MIGGFMDRTAWIERLLVGFDQQWRERQFGAKPRSTWTHSANGGARQRVDPQVGSACIAASFPPISARISCPQQTNDAAEGRTFMAEVTRTGPSPKAARVGLFVTCLVDLIRPAVGFAAVKLLENAGCSVSVPRQACCGQPAFNSGDRATTREIAEQVIEGFASCDYVVVPSGSCGGMLKTHYPELFRNDPIKLARAEAFAAKTFELVSFLTDVLGVTQVDASLAATVTYHDACSGLRELGIKTQPRRLLAGVRGLTLTEMHDPDVCCGFGGTFCVKYPAISNVIVGRKAESIVATGADLLLAGDLGCLMNMAGKLQRDGSKIAVRHVAEVLAGMTGDPPIGEPRGQVPKPMR